ncbi:MAG: DUF4143 domain-containing protein [Propionibacteriaceae bacterium]|nr:DUF4143 domain-containing protein [Propionibacteriaceae bacterium]
MDYLRRVVDDELDELLGGATALALEGAKGVGKTATAAQRANSALRLVDPRQLEILRADLDVVSRMEPPVLIDEWQYEPAVWDSVRRWTDDEPEPGRFLLTGSAGPPPGTRIHSGAGRILRVVMRPLSLPERGIQRPTVSLHGLLAGGAEVRGESDVDLPTYTDEILGSGFPGIRPLRGRARRAQIDSYVARIVERDLSDQGMAVRRPAALKAWLTAYAAATATTSSWSVILDAATPGEDDKPSRQTVMQYREHLERLFILEPLPAWLPTFSALKRLGASPKHHLVDPGLAASLVGADADTLLAGEGDRVGPAAGTLLGALFESLATQTVRVLAQNGEASVSHLRTRGGEHEVDLIVEGRGRAVVALEVKLAETVSDSDVRHLLWLRNEIGDRLRDMVVLTTGQFAYRRPDGVAVVPLALLGA